MWPVFLLLNLFVVIFIAYWPKSVLIIECFLVVSYSCWYWLAEPQKDAPISVILLQADGEITLDGVSGYRLHANSRVGWLGCWLLCYSPKAKTSAKFIHKFYAKQQFSPQDYARLSRIILCNNAELNHADVLVKSPSAADHR
ncbi:hypothetical protein [Thalassotalea insulae]|nr:hypothetical protein [Thalassotalea insulae]